jgi:tripartite-type tricarboxylate transporter receptor subunit TctC
MVLVPYKGGAQATIDMLSGQIPLVIQPVVSFLQHAKSGKLKVLAVFLAERWEGLPDVPTVKEAVPGFEKPAGGMGVWGPARLSEAIALRLQSAMAGALRSPEVSGKLKSDGLLPVGNPPAAFAEDIRQSVAIYERLVKAAGIQPN